MGGHIVSWEIITIYPSLNRKHPQSGPFWMSSSMLAMVTKATPRYRVMAIYQL